MTKCEARVLTFGKPNIIEKRTLVNRYLGKDQVCVSSIINYLCFITTLETTIIYGTDWAVRGSCQEFGVGHS